MLTLFVVRGGIVAHEQVLTLVLLVKMFNRNSSFEGMQ
jgi:hypothetical protein